LCGENIPAHSCIVEIKGSEVEAEWNDYFLYEVVAGLVLGALCVDRYGGDGRRRICFLKLEGKVPPRKGVAFQEGPEV